MEHRDERKIAEEKLGAMVRIPTVSKHEHEDLSQFYRYHEELEKLFPLLHEKLEKTVLTYASRVCMTASKLRILL